MPVIGPAVQYPTPWRIAETNGEGHPIVVCQDGNYVAECPTTAAATAIVEAVNNYKGA